MFNPTRIITTSIYLISIALTLFFGLVKPKILLALMFGFIELCAMVWYAISYIPYAHNLILKGLGLA